MLRKKNYPSYYDVFLKKSEQDKFFKKELTEIINIFLSFSLSSTFKKNNNKNFTVNESRISIDEKMEGFSKKETKFPLKYQIDHFSSRFFSYINSFKFKSVIINVLFKYVYQKKHEIKFVEILFSFFQELNSSKNDQMEIIIPETDKNIKKLEEILKGKKINTSTEIKDGFILKIKNRKMNVTSDQFLLKIKIFVKQYMERRLINT